MKSLAVVKKFDSRIGNPVAFASRFVPQSGVFAWDLAHEPDFVLQRVADDLPAFLTGTVSAKAMGKQVRFEDEEGSVSENDNLEYPSLFESPEYQPYSPALSAMSLQSSTSDVYEISSPVA